MHNPDSTSDKYSSAFVSDTTNATTITCSSPELATETTKHPQVPDNTVLCQQQINTNVDQVKPSAPSKTLAPTATTQPHNMPTLSQLHSTAIPTNYPAQGLDTFAMEHQLAEARKRAVQTLMERHMNMSPSQLHLPPHMMNNQPVSISQLQQRSRVGFPGQFFPPTTASTVASTPTMHTQQVPTNTIGAWNMEHKETNLDLSTQRAQKLRKLATLEQQVSVSQVAAALAAQQQQALLLQIASAQQHQTTSPLMLPAYQNRLRQLQALQQQLLQGRPTTPPSTISLSHVLNQRGVNVSSMEHLPPTARPLGNSAKKPMLPVEEPPKMDTESFKSYLTSSEEDTAGTPEDVTSKDPMPFGKQCGCENKCITHFFNRHRKELGQVHKLCKSFKSTIENPMSNKRVLEEIRQLESSHATGSKKAKKEFLKRVRSDARTKRDEYIRMHVLPTWKDSLCVKGLVAITCTSNAYFYNKRGHGMGPRADEFLVRRRRARKRVRDCDSPSSLGADE